MTQLEIFNTEKNNYNRIILYREGLFWKAYEKSAYAFVKQINPYSASKKFIRVVGDNITSIGFPASVIDKYGDRLDIVSSDENQLVITSKLILEEDFIEWKTSVALKEAKPMHSSIPVAIVSPTICDNRVETVENLIQKFPIENKTPVECILFIVQLKQLINGNI